MVSIAIAIAMHLSQPPKCIIIVRQHGHNVAKPTPCLKVVRHG